MTSPYMPSIETGAKPIAFGDFRFYWLIERGIVTIKPLNEKYALNEQTGFLCSERIDGRLTRREAVKALQMAEEE